MVISGLFCSVLIENKDKVTVFHLCDKIDLEATIFLPFLLVLFEAKEISSKVCWGKESQMSKINLLQNSHKK